MDTNLMEVFFIFKIQILKHFQANPSVVGKIF